MMKKMIFILLLLITLPCSVCETFECRSAPSFYQVFKNEDVTLEWTFTNSSLDSLQILCVVFTDHDNFKLLEYDNGVERPLHGPFKGRVQLDKDVLRERTVRLHVSSLRTEDSGFYVCYLDMGYGSVLDIYYVNVKEPQTAPETTTEPQTEGRNTGAGGRIGLGSGPLATVICACIVIFLNT